MGSAATADVPLMTKLMTALREHHLFFLDSRTIGRSVAGKMAKEQGVRALDRHIFLDDSNAFADVQRQFQVAVQYAQKHGTAIAIGHPRKNTIAVLQAALPICRQMCSWFLWAVFGGMKKWYRRNRLFSSLAPHPPQPRRHLMKMCHRYVACLKCCYIKIRYYVANAQNTC